MLYYTSHCLIIPFLIPLPFKSLLGGPDGDDAFSSLTSLQRVHREKKIRSTEQKQLLRDIKGRNKELGTSLSAPQVASTRGLLKGRSGIRLCV